MSDTPKYSRVRISEAVRRRLKEEARRRAEERAARRAAEAARRKEERFRKNQLAFNERLEALRGELAAFDGTLGSRHVIESLRQLQSRLVGFGQIANEESLVRAEKELYRVDRELRQTIAQGKATQDAQELDQEAATVLRWKYQAAEDRQSSRQFDPDGLARFEDALGKVEAHLARKDLAEARRAMTAVGRQFQVHRAEVERQRGLWLTRKEAAELALAGLHEKVAALQLDSGVQRWRSHAIETIGVRAEQLTNLMKCDQFERITREAGKLSAETEEVLRAAEEQQSRKQERDYVAECTLRALQACGFTIDGITQSQEGTNSDRVIQAHRLDGRAVAVNVRQEGAMQWSVDGFPMHVVPGSSGGPANICDEAVDQIEAIQELLAHDYGVETSELTWNGQDPDRPRKTGKSLRPQVSRQKVWDVRP